MPSTTQTLWTQNITEANTARGDLTQEKHREMKTTQALEKEKFWPSRTISAQAHKKPNFYTDRKMSASQDLLL